MATGGPEILKWMGALADATRSRVLRLLDRHELTVAELCMVLQLPQSTVSRHLKVLAGEGWAAGRRQGTSSLWRMTLQDLDSSARRLWTLLRQSMDDQRWAQQDDRRLTEALAMRQTRSQAFFASAAGRWDRLRDEMFGQRFDLQAMLGLVNDQWTVGDLGCGTGQVAEALAPFVKQVVAVDASEAMLTAARKRLKPLANVQVRRGELQSLPLGDGELDAAVTMLVLHHLPEPAAAIVELARVVRPGGKLLLVDMIRHDRAEYQQTMGHVWLGFEQREIEQWLESAGCRLVRWASLPVEAEARGPSLFLAIASPTGK